LWPVGQKGGRGGGNRFADSVSSQPALAKGGKKKEKKRGHYWICAVGSSPKEGEKGKKDPPYLLAGEQAEVHLHWLRPWGKKKRGKKKKRKKHYDLTPADLASGGGKKKEGGEKGSKLNFTCADWERKRKKGTIAELRFSAMRIRVNEKKKEKKKNKEFRFFTRLGGKAQPGKREKKKSCGENCS